jgi:hypothetical protein
VLFDVASMPDYGKLSQPLARRDDRRRPRRGRALQARPDGLRAVEAVEAGGAGWPVPGASRPGRAGTSNARRWPARCSARPSTSTAAASTSSSRTTRTRSPSRAAPTARRDGQLLDAQRLPAGRGREDVEEPREFRHDPGVAGERSHEIHGIASTAEGGDGDRPCRSRGPKPGCTAALTLLGLLVGSRSRKAGSETKRRASSEVSEATVAAMVHRGPRRGPQGEGLRRGRPHPRELEAHGHRAQGRQGPATGEPVTTWEVKR